MRLTLLGTGSAMPTGERAQSGSLLEGEQCVLVDCGSGVLDALARTEPGFEGVDAVLLTHHHLDHVADLLPLLKARWLAGADPLTVAGPPGTAALLEDLLDAFDYLDEKVACEARDVDAPGFSLAGFDVRAREVRHSAYCLAYRFGDAVTFSGDTEAFEGLASFAAGSAALVHDCSFPDGVDVSNHPTPSQLGAALAGHDCGTVYLTHRYPQTEGRDEDLVAAVTAAYGGPVRAPEDGHVLDLPAPDG
ncbi:MAG: MBL fold metallo-hydrolase [Halobacteriaceae archaeon]